MRFEPYSDYRDSQIDWIAQIPSHWKLQSIKSLLVERVEKNDPIKTTEILSLTMDRGVIPYAERGGGGNKAKEDISSYKLAYPNDIVLNSMNIVAGSVGLSNYFGAVSPVYYMLYSRGKDVNIDYYNKIFSSTEFQRSLLGLGNGILMKETESTGKLNTIRLKIPIDKLNIQYLPFPPIEEQLRITNFLDRETLKINKLIHKQEKLIDLLGEKLKGIIDLAVTRGVTRDVPMKNVNGGWFNEIPQHWDACALKHLVSMKSGEQITSQDIVEEGEYPVYGGNGMRGFAKNFTHNGFYPLIGRQGALCGNINYADGFFWASEHAVVVTPLFSSNILWLGELLRSMDLGKYSVAAAQPGLSVDNISRLKVPVPPVDEQNEIAEYIEIQSRKINLLIDKSKKSIELMKEHRASLILSSVTGKIDLRYYD